VLQWSEENVLVCNLTIHKFLSNFLIQNEKLFEDRLQAIPQIFLSEAQYLEVMESHLWEECRAQVRFTVQLQC
jgi:low affinity Fe/Cu permease